MNIDSKLRPIYLARILYERTDKNHTLTTNELIRILKDEYNVEGYRITVKNDIQILIDLGMDIKSYLSTQMHYWMDSRQFDTAELKFLIDAVQSSKFITKKRSEILVEKLTKLSGNYQAEELKRNLMVEGRVKSENEKGMAIIDAINAAINAGKKISFQMNDYSPKKRRILHNNGECYVFSPYALVWDGDCYYMVGYSDKYNRIGSHRADRIADIPEILEEECVPAPKGFKIDTYINTMFRMFDSERSKVELLCDNDVMTAFVDRFGSDFKVRTADEDHFLAKVDIAVSHVFYSWVFGFGGKVKIIGPEEVKNEYNSV